MSQDLTDMKSTLVQLTHWGQDKIATILHATFSKISLTFVAKAPINNIPALVQIMAWPQQAIIWTNDGEITDAYMCHSAPMS